MHQWFHHGYIWGSLLLLLLSRFSRVRLCNPVDGSPPGSPIPGILQARTLEWVAISFSNVWKWKVKVKSLSRVWFFQTPWTAAYQAPLSMGFSRQEYWSGVPLTASKTRGFSKLVWCIAQDSAFFKASQMNLMSNQGGTPPVERLRGHSVNRSSLLESSSGHWLWFSTCIWATLLT